MSSESPPARKPRSKPALGSPPLIDEHPPLPATLRVLDWILIASFLALTFLLGIFPLKDTDFWWHLRTGDWIREHHTVPVSDLYTFTVPDHPWIDLHWGFQVALSWGYAHGGVVALNLAKCVITCIALLLVITTKKRDWPVWVMLLAWLPALLVLSGRMYVRPETFTLLYLCADLAILFRWDKHPRLAFLLPIVQVAWVNSQGLFVLGPILIGFALIAAIFRPGAFAPSRTRWWRTVGIATLLTGAACLLNPYGLMGAIYPLQLLQTMGNPIFSKSIAELTPIPEFIRRNVGWYNLPLCLQLLTIILGALSFVVPILWSVAARTPASSPPIDPQVDPSAQGTSTKDASKPKRKSAKRTKPAQEPSQERVRDWSMTLFRFLLFAAFCRLSWQATRNSHQFAAVVGTITAWNLAEWAAAIRRRRPRIEGESLAPFILPRLATLGCIAFVFAIVATGRLYAWTGEDRRIGLGEEPLWFPHEAVKFAGKPGMPNRFLSFHDGYAALYDYYHGAERTPGLERKVFVDARLEVVGPELYERYLNLQSEIAGLKESSNWPAQLDEIGRPVILVGHAANSMIGANLMTTPHWRCVWFDPIVALFVHDSNAEVVRTAQVNFAARHFQPSSATIPQGIDALIASAKAIWAYAGVLQAHQRPDLARPMVLLGLDYARRIHQADLESPNGWKLIGELESAREAAIEPKHRVQRYRLPFDPVFDLSAVRATYALRRAHLAAPNDFLTLLLLSQQYQDRLMNEAAAPLHERLIGLRPINPNQSETQAKSANELAKLREQLGPEIGTTWENLSELDRIVASMLDSGRAEPAADLLERAYPSETRPWEITDRIATLRLHLGEAERARVLWQKASNPSQPAIRSARVAVSYLVEGVFDEARRHYQEALRDDADLFEAHYGLAILEQDAGRATEALRHARMAADHAPKGNNVAKAAAQTIVGETLPFAEL
ncbi:Tetratricopeptide (TPR) repeat [Singulisphaera sp. GP187]|uniref:tetratricopeptide repeat protein n=1 Tax=Singulisphaera sp. GP187 TaxID=1882752 RepID=UPI00092B04A1|nr:tetratricopeptide repeat protein [Singulisphaera sp. GP187]SIN92394.1 Tetratricopeptide (TPR) repeat [Singulisphaera sp. GP187]